MENKGFSYSFTFPELVFFLFGKKKCPKCGCNLVKKKSYEIRTDLFHEDSAGTIFKPDSEVKQYSYSYHCEKCGFKSTLSELAKKK